jgi:lipoate-protein ligase A
MAVDEVLLNTFVSGISDPVIRTYGWSPPSLSLGRFQNAYESLDLERCRRDSVSVIRRISGGGAIYHTDELTYSLVCSVDHLPTGLSVKESFRLLNGFLLEFYSRLGLSAVYATDSTPNAAQFGVRTPFCFAGKESFDILIHGRKIGGNAQRRFKNVIFQHGSIPIINRAQRGLGYMIDCSPAYAADCVSLVECGVSAQTTALKSLLLEAFRHHMGAETTMSTLTSDEHQGTHTLIKTKYDTVHWNLRGVSE